MSDEQVDTRAEREWLARLGGKGYWSIEDASALVDRVALYIDALEAQRKAREEAERERDECEEAGQKLAAEYIAVEYRLYERDEAAGQAEAELQRLRERAEKAERALEGTSYMLGMEEQSARRGFDNAQKLEASLQRLREALEYIAEAHDSGRHDGRPEPCPAHDDVTMWAIARDALNPPTDHDRSAPTDSDCLPLLWSLRDAAQGYADGDVSLQGLEEVVEEVDAEYPRSTDDPPRHDDWRDSKTKRPEDKRCAEHS